jgi:multiple sugar transport system substrate-binding protein
MGNVERTTQDLADEFMTGTLSRRQFITRLLALGLSVSAAGAILAACSSAATNAPSVAAATAAGTAGPASSLPAGAATPVTGLTGNVRFLIGPWTPDEVKHQQVIEAAFKKNNPGVNFTYKLYDWSTGSQEIADSLAQGAHDIYYTGEANYAALYSAANTFEDLTSRINDPAFASEKAKYLYWDRVAQYGPKLMGLPICWHVEDALFANMDMVKAAGYDETFVESWDTFVACVKKMTTADVYGLGIGIQLGPTFGEWYQMLRSAGGSFLTPDLKATNVNLPNVVTVTQRYLDLYKAGVVPPNGTYDYNTAPDAFVAGRMAIYSSDLTIAAVLQGKKPSFQWKVLGFPPGPASRANFNDMGFYQMSSKMTDKDLGWEVLKWWTNGDSDAYWAGVSGTYPARADALDHGFAGYSTQQLADAFTGFQKIGIGQEPFPQWGDCETAAEQQAGNAWTGQVSAQDAVTNIEKAVKKLVFG